VKEKVFSVLTNFVRVSRFPRQVLFYPSYGIIQSEKVDWVEILGSGRLAVVAGMHPLTASHTGRRSASSTLLFPVRRT